MMIYHTYCACLTRENCFGEKKLKVIVFLFFCFTEQEDDGGKFHQKNGILLVYELVARGILSNYVSYCVDLHINK